MAKTPKYSRTHLPASDANEALDRFIVAAKRAIRAIENGEPSLAKTTLKVLVMYHSNHQ